MAGKNTAVYGIFRDQSDVIYAVEKMTQAGFRNEDISVLLPNNPGTKDFGHEKHTKGPEGAAAGVVAGGLIGGLLGLLVGLGTLAIPGLVPLTAAGPIIATLAGVGAGATVGGLLGWLVGLSVPEYEAKRYEGRVRDRGVLASVHCDNADWTRRAKELLKETGAADISSATEASADFAKTDRPLRRPRVPGTL
ncbi:MAG: DUF3341 domain-containing protein [Bryobacteraceae bacterium]|jgi:hypothetical protein